MESPLIDFVNKIFDIVLQRVIEWDIKADHFEVQFEFTYEFLDILVLIFLDFLFDGREFGNFTVDEPEIEQSEAFEFIMLKERDAFSIGFEVFDELESFLYFFFLVSFH